MKFANIKAATVAIAKVHNIHQEIFEIVGSGVCIDPAGIVLTCEHVVEFVKSRPPGELGDLADMKKMLRGQSPGE